MAAGAFKMFTPTALAIGAGTLDLDDSTAGRFRAVLVTSSYTPDQDAHDTWSDISANEASGTGYTAGGKALTSVAWTQNAGTTTCKWDADDVSWTSSTITAKYLVIVEDSDADGTLAAGDLVVGYIDLDTGGGSLSSSSGTFSVQFHADGILTATTS